MALDYEKFLNFDGEPKNKGNDANLKVTPPPPPVETNYVDPPREYAPSIENLTGGKTSDLQTELLKGNDGEYNKPLGYYNGLYPDNTPHNRIIDDLLGKNTVAAERRRKEYNQSNTAGTPQVVDPDISGGKQQQVTEPAQEGTPTAPPQYKDKNDLANDLGLNAEPYYNQNREKSLKSKQNAAMITDVLRLVGQASFGSDGYKGQGMNIAQDPENPVLKQTNEELLRMDQLYDADVRRSRDVNLQNQIQNERLKYSEEQEDARWKRDELNRQDMYDQSNKEYDRRYDKKLQDKRDDAETSHGYDIKYRKEINKGNATLQAQKTAAAKDKVKAAKTKGDYNTAVRDAVDQQIEMIKATAKNTNQDGDFGWEADTFNLFPKYLQDVLTGETEGSPSHYQQIYDIMNSREWMDKAPAENTKEADNTEVNTPGAEDWSQYEEDLP